MREKLKFSTLLQKSIRYIIIYKGGIIVLYGEGETPWSVVYFFMTDDEIHHELECHQRYPRSRYPPYWCDPREKLIPYHLQCLYYQNTKNAVFKNYKYRLNQFFYTKEKLLSELKEKESNLRNLEEERLIFLMAYKKLIEWGFVREDADTILLPTDKKIWL